MKPDGVGNGTPLVYSNDSLGLSTGSSPTTPGPLTSCSRPSASVMRQCRVLSCTVSVAEIGDVDGVGPEEIAVARRRPLRHKAGRDRDLDLAGYGAVHRNAVQLYIGRGLPCRSVSTIMAERRTRKKSRSWPRFRRERDLRLDLFRGIALWLIFLDHIPSNAVSWITIRNYGFTDATEIFVFISGYTAAFVYGRAMRQHGFVIASARVLKRAWQIYVAHVFLFAIYLAEIAYVAHSFDNPLYTEEMGVLDFLKNPDVTILQALLLKFKPVNMDVLPLYIVLLAWFPPMLWLLLRAPSIALIASAVLYVLDVVCSSGTFPPIRSGTGCSIRSPGNCCSCSAPGARSAARSGCRAGSIREFVRRAGDCLSACSPSASR